MEENDDFQFRPLTDGLGFQGKEVPKKAQPLFQNSDFADLEVRAPLPRKPFDLDETPTPQKTPASTVDEILKTLNEKRSFDFNEKGRDILRQEAPIQYKKTTWEISASLLDGMLVTALTLLCLISLLMITKVDLFANLYNPDSQYMIYWGLGALVATITWSYLVFTRLFMNATPGEWVFDQQLGTHQQQGTLGYSMKVLLRSTVVVATGLIIFPILSLLMNRDLLGRMMKLELVRKG